MKAICFVDIEQVETRMVADPEISDPTDAVVRVALAGLCGSDLHAFHGRETGLDVGTVMGHEFVGEVVEIGSAVESFQVGDRVGAPFTTSCGKCFYCQSGLTSRCERGQLFGWCSGGNGLHGGQAELIRVTLADGTLVKLDETISDPMALLLGDNLSTGFFCAEMAEVKQGGTYVVIGCGTVGLLAIHAAMRMGAGRVFALDLIPARRELANQMGAVSLPPDNAAVVQIKEETEGRGVDGVMELVGLPAAQVMAYRLVRPGGVLSVVGCHSSDHFSFSPVDAYDKNLTIRTGRCPARAYMNRQDEMLGDEIAVLEGLITHQFDIDDSVAAYDTFANRRDGCIKAVVRFA